jgi:hypothetical protein
MFLWFNPLSWFIFAPKLTTFGRLHSEKTCNFRIFQVYFPSEPPKIILNRPLRQKSRLPRSTVAEESLMAIRTVVAFGGEASAMRRFERELTRAKMGGIRASGHGVGMGSHGLSRCTT